MVGIGITLPLAVLAGVAIVLAITAFRQARVREERARANAEHARMMKNQFVSMVSHELRTPLTSIAGFADTLITSWRDLSPSEVDEFLRIITAQAQHLGELVEDVLVIPRLESGRLKIQSGRFDVGQLVHEVVDALVAVSSDQQASVAIPAGVEVYADRSRVQQILRNLVENAMKYGGGQILVEGRSEGDLYVVTVDDDGPGIPLEDRDRIFEHFEQLTKGDNRRDEGVGLGLPIARKLARAMGGDLWHEARFPTGSRFSFTITASETVDASPATSSVAPAFKPDHKPA